MPKQAKRARLPLRFWVIGSIVIILLFVPALRRQQDTLTAQQQEIRDLQQQNYEESMRSDQIRAQIAAAGTDRFIEQEARRRYGYMMPGEIRFEMDNLPTAASDSLMQGLPGMVPDAAVPATQDAPVAPEPAQDPAQVPDDAQAPVAEPSQTDTPAAPPPPVQQPLVTPDDSPKEWGFSD